MVVLSSLRATLWSFGRRPPPASAAAAVLVLGAGIVKRQLSALSERITESASGELEGPAELGWRIRNRCDQLFSKHSSPPQGFGLAGGVPFIHSTHSSPPQGFQPRWRGTFLCGCQKLRCGGGDLRGESFECPVFSGVRGGKLARCRRFSCWSDFLCSGFRFVFPGIVFWWSWCVLWTPPRRSGPHSRHQIRVTQLISYSSSNYLHLHAPTHTHPPYRSYPAGRAHRSC